MGEGRTDTCATAQSSMGEGCSRLALNVNTQPHLSRFLNHLPSGTTSHAAPAYPPRPLHVDARPFLHPNCSNLHFTEPILFADMDHVPSRRPHKYPPIPFHAPPVSSSFYPYPTLSRSLSFNAFHEHSHQEQDFTPWGPRYDAVPTRLGWHRSPEKETNKRSTNCRLEERAPCCSRSYLGCQLFYLVSFHLVIIPSYFDLLEPSQ
jgi:hypothetical protein